MKGYVRPIHYKIGYVLKYCDQINLESTTMTCFIIILWFWYMKPQNLISFRFWDQTFMIDAWTVCSGIEVCSKIIFKKELFFLTAFYLSHSSCISHGFSIWTLKFLADRVEAPLLTEVAIEGWSVVPQFLLLQPWGHGMESQVYLLLGFLVPWILEDTDDSMGPVPTTTDVFIRHRITYCIAIYVEENARYGILIHYENYSSPEN